MNRTHSRYHVLGERGKKRLRGVAGGQRDDELQSVQALHITPLARAHLTNVTVRRRRQVGQSALLHRDSLLLADVHQAVGDLASTTYASFLRPRRGTREHQVVALRRQRAHLRRLAVVADADWLRL
mgnify:CR=1 FL=1